jgi:hypothetical protein
MTEADRYRLLGAYRTPCFGYGQLVRCEVRGAVTITGCTAAPIPWPTGLAGRGGASLLAASRLKRC